MSSIESLKSVVEVISRLHGQKYDAGREHSMATEIKSMLSVLDRKLSTEDKARSPYRGLISDCESFLKFYRSKKTGSLKSNTESFNRLIDEIRITIEHDVIPQVSPPKSDQL